MRLEQIQSLINCNENQPEGEALKLLLKALELTVQELNRIETFLYDQGLGGNPDKTLSYYVDRASCL